MFNKYKYQICPMMFWRSVTVACIKLGMTVNYDASVVILRHIYRRIRLFYDACIDLYNTVHAFHCSSNDFGASGQWIRNCLASVLKQTRGCWFKTFFRSPDFSQRFQDEDFDSFRSGRRRRRIFDGLCRCQVGRLFTALRCSNWYHNI